MTLPSAEKRLLSYGSNMERFWETTKHYKDAGPLGVIAGGVHLVTQGFGLDPLIKDVGRKIDGNQSSLEAYEGWFARTRLNISETLGDLVHLKVFSAATKVINLVGDHVADWADAVAYVPHRQHQVRQNIGKVLAA
ncbi:hypothetical protein A2635_01495 [Candidatus Peribacteria bacterium RIFCSPHIGHO2_01_FULL_51_9]|nr:MAG: hypothetical protein A2635_01495 [Candidatus Peribacteria bacterium RIFCSPHIGHO2_01_FULL_51_9]